MKSETIPDKITKEVHRKKKGAFMKVFTKPKKSKFSLAGALCLVFAPILAASLCSCSSSGGADKFAPNEGSEYIYKYDDSAKENSSGGDSTVLSERKLIRTVTMRLETKNFDVLIPSIENQVTACGGYLESSSIGGNGYSTKSNRSATIVCRVPADSLDGFLDGIGENCIITSKSESASDVTLSYVDMESRIEVLESEKKALESILADAKDISSILEIRSRLTEVISSLESYNSQLRAMENQVSYSTVTISVYEVEIYTEITEKGYFEEIGDGLADTFASIAEGAREISIFIIVNLPYMLIFALVVGLIVFILIRSGKKRKKKADAKKNGNAPQ